MTPMRVSGGASTSVLRVARAGDFTVTIDGNVEEFARQALQAALGETVRLMEAEMQPIADQARAEWYGPQGVTRRTGQSGDIRVVTTIDTARDEVRVGIGSTDGREAKGRYVAVFVHRPKSLSLIRKEVDNATWWATPEAMRANYRPRRKGKENEADPPGSGPYIYVLNPLASDGKKLMEEHVRKPATLKLRNLSPALRDAILERLGGR